MHPDENGLKVIQMATSQLSYTAVKLAGRDNKKDTTKNQKQNAVVPLDQKEASSETKDTHDALSDEQGGGGGGWLETIRVLVNEVNLKIQASIDQRDNAPPLLNLTGLTTTTTTTTATKKNKTKKTRTNTLKQDSSQFRPYIKGNNGDLLKLERRTPAEKLKALELEQLKAQYENSDDDEEEEEEEGKEKEEGAKGEEEKEGEEGEVVALKGTVNDPAMMQWADMLVWELEQTPPDPGQAEPQPKYIPVDPTVLPRRCTTRTEAVDALRQTDRICTLIANQHYCIKNSKYVIASLIQHVMTTVIPLPKPRGLPKSKQYLRKIQKGQTRKLERCRVMFCVVPGSVSMAEYRQYCSGTTTPLMLKEVGSPGANKGGMKRGTKTNVVPETKESQESKKENEEEESKARVPSWVMDVCESVIDEQYRRKKKENKTKGKRDPTLSTSTNNEMYQLKHNISWGQVTAPNEKLQATPKETPTETPIETPMLVTVITCRTPKEAKAYVKSFEEIIKSNKDNKDQIKATLWANAPNEMKQLYTTATTTTSTTATKKNTPDSNAATPVPHDIDYEQVPLRGKDTVLLEEDPNASTPLFEQGMKSSSCFLNYDSEHRSTTTTTTESGNESGNPCIWDAPIDYALQVELQMTLLRLMEHFSSAAFSIPQSRSIDAVCCIVPACIAVSVGVGVYCLLLDSLVGSSPQPNLFYYHSRSLCCRYCFCCRCCLAGVVRRDHAAHGD